LRSHNRFNNLNGILVHKLKDKFGTRSLPTAELELRGTKAYLVGNPGEGVKIISILFNLTRLYCMNGAISSMRRMLALVRDFSFKRKVFGRPLSENNLHLRTVSKMEIMYRGCMHFTFNLVHKLGITEAISLNFNHFPPMNNNNQQQHAGATAEPEMVESLLRLLTPIGKLYVTKISVQVNAEGQECFGGQGYIEDTGIPVIYRDNFVNSIWEGTTNVLSHDVLRALLKDPKALDHFSNAVLHEYLGPAVDAFGSRDKEAMESIMSIKEILNEVLKLINPFKIAKKNSIATAMKMIDATARELAYSMGYVYTSSLLWNHAAWSKDPVDVYVAKEFSKIMRCQPLTSFEDMIQLDKAIALQSKL